MVYKFGISIILLLLSATIFQSCKKREAGVCYCDYVSGDKKEFNLKDLKRSEQIDSCFILDGNANGFGGSCELE